MSELLDANDAVASLRTRLTEVEGAFERLCGEIDRAMPIVDLQDSVEELRQSLGSAE